MGSACSRDPEASTTYHLSSVSSNCLKVPRNARGKRFTKIVVKLKPEAASKIESLNLNKNPVKTIVGVEKLVGVKKVDAQSCGFASVPRWIANLPALETVNLYVNATLEAPAWFLGLASLVTLSLCHNRRLQSIPSPGENLTTLNISFCDIRSLPPDFFHGRLKTVDLRNNNYLQSIPSPGEHLTTLNISFCDIRSLPPDFFHGRLETVVLQNNRNLQSIPSPGEHLTTLDINDCDILFLPPDLFHGRLTNFRWESGNKNLQSFPSPGKHLTKLNLSKRDIRSLPNDFFHYQLQDVKLNGNKGKLLGTWNKLCHPRV